MVKMEILILYGRRVRFQVDETYPTVCQGHAHTLDVKFFLDNNVRNKLL